MGAVLKLGNRYIHHIYYYIGVFYWATALIMLSEKSSTLSIFLIGSSIGFSLFWSIEFAARWFAGLQETKHAKYLPSIIVFGRWTVLSVLLYFLLYFLVPLIAIDKIGKDDILCMIVVFIVLFGDSFLGFLGISKQRDERIDIEKEVGMSVIASYALTFVLAICIGYFGGRWIGGELGNAAIGSYIGFALGTAAGVLNPWNALGLLNLLWNARKSTAVGCYIKH